MAGNPEAFAEGHGGAGGGTPPVSDAPHWAWKQVKGPLNLQHRPNLPHPETEGAYGDYAPIQLTDEQKAANADARKSQAEFDATYESQQKARGGRGGTTSGSGYKATKEVTPTNRTRGVHVEQTEATPIFVKRISRIHTFLSDRARELSANKFGVHSSHAEIAPDSLAGYSLSQGQDLLDKASRHIEEGKNWQFGRNGKIANDAEANYHYLQAAHHIRDAHAFIHNETMDEATSGKHLATFAVPDSHIEEMIGHAKTLRIQKPALPFSTVKIGKTERVAVGSDRFNELRKLAGTMAKLPVTQGGSTAPKEKLDFAARGMKRPRKLRERIAKQKSLDSSKGWGVRGVKSVDGKPKSTDVGDEAKDLIDRMVKAPQENDGVVPNDPRKTSQGQTVPIGRIQTSRPGATPGFDATSAVKGESAASEAGTVPERSDEEVIANTKQRVKSQRKKSRVDSGASSQAKEATAAVNALPSGEVGPGPRQARMDAARAANLKKGNPKKGEAK